MLKFGAGERVAASPGRHTGDVMSTSQLDSLVAIRTDTEYTIIFWIFFLLKVSIQPLALCLGIRHFWHMFLGSRMRFQAEKHHH